ncbi:MAG: hypothetical protein AAGG38_13735 [Planctomycetota bacterium]
MKNKENAEHFNLGHIVQIVFTYLAGLAGVFALCIALVKSGPAGPPPTDLQIESSVETWLLKNTARVQQDLIFPVVKRNQQLLKGDPGRDATAPKFETRSRSIALSNANSTSGEAVGTSTFKFVSNVKHAHVALSGFSIRYEGNKDQHLLDVGLTTDFEIRDHSIIVKTVGRLRDADAKEKINGTAHITCFAVLE